MLHSSVKRKNYRFRESNSANHMYTKTCTNENIFFCIEFSSFCYSGLLNFISFVPSIFYLYRLDDFYKWIFLLVFQMKRFIKTRSTQIEVALFILQSTFISFRLLFVLYTISYILSFCVLFFISRLLNSTSLNSPKFGDNNTIYHNTILDSHASSNALSLALFWTRNIQTLFLQDAEIKEFL